MSVTPSRSTRANTEKDSESFVDFQSLHLQEVRCRAEAVEARPREIAGSSLPCARAAWRGLYRDMRRTRASTVANLRRHEVEHHASKLGYGYFRIRLSSRDAFMPLPR
jgi:hypothetical protein